jgi:hypothetical protein
LVIAWQLELAIERLINANRRTLYGCLKAILLHS